MTNADVDTIVRKDADVRAACFLLEQVAKRAGFVANVDLGILSDLFYSAVVLAYIKGRQDLQRKEGYHVHRTETINRLH